MKTIFEIMQESRGCSGFEVLIKEDGMRIYRTWNASTIWSDGKIVAFGVHYHPFLTIVAPNDVDIIDTIEMTAEEYEKLHFVESPQRWAMIMGIDTEELIGLSRDEFTKKMMNPKA